MLSTKGTFLFRKGESAESFGSDVALVLGDEPLLGFVSGDLVVEADLGFLGLLLGDAEAWQSVCVCVCVQQVSVWLCVCGVVWCVCV